MASHEFTHSLKILPLHSYDMIVGMDWLEKFSPMKVDWKQKWMQISTDRAVILLSGSPELQSTDLMFQIMAVQAIDQSIPATDTMPPDIQAILSQFQSVCDPPSDLPPRRPYDHCIPLIQGARPVNIRLYRYPPTLKNEIEAQVS